LSLLLLCMPFIWSSATLFTLLRMPCSFADLMIADYLLGYVNWFHSPLTSIMSPVRYSAALALPCPVLSAVPQGTVHLPPQVKCAFQCAGLRETRIRSVTLLSAS